MPAHYRQMCPVCRGCCRQGSVVTPTDNSKACCGQLGSAQVVECITGALVLQFMQPSVFLGTDNAKSMSDLTAGDVIIPKIVGVVDHVRMSMTTVYWHS